MWNLPTDYDYQTDLEKSRFTGTWKKKPYKCQFCEYSSSWKDHLKVHITYVHEKRSLLNVIFVILLVHTSVIWNYMFLLFMREKSLSKFELCNFKSSTKNDLSNHVASIHERKSLYMWNLWEKFALKPYLRKHEAAIHKRKMPI